MSSSFLLIAGIVLGVIAISIFNSSYKKEIYKGVKEGSEGMVWVGVVLFMLAAFSFITYSIQESDEEKEQKEKLDVKQLAEAKEHGFDSYEAYKLDEGQLSSAYSNCIRHLREVFPYGAEVKWFHGGSRTFRNDNGDIYVVGDDLQITNEFNAKRYTQYNCRCSSDGKDCEVNLPLRSLHRIE